VPLPQEHEELENEGLPTKFEGQDHQEKRHTNLMCDSQNKSHKETPPKASHKNHQKGEMLGDKETLDEPRRIFYTYHERFIQGLTRRPNIQPSVEINHEAFKLAYRKPKGKGKTRKQMN
jgi:hypothetical protein